MMKVFVKIIIIWMFCLADIHLNELDVSIANICGGVRNCSFAENVQISSDSCCRPCECTDICLEKDSCCHDSDKILPANVTKQVCLSSVSYAKTGTDNRHFTKYFVRAKCPEGYPRNETRRKCEDDVQESILNIPFVSSEDGSVIYKNRHCAACFNEDNIIPWEVEIDWICMKYVFSDYDGVANQTYLIKMLIKTCTLIFKRPKNTNWKSTVCYQSNELLSSCSDTNYSNFGYGALYDELKNKCENERNTLTVFYSNGYTPYANIYCFLCNKGNVPLTCDKDGPTRIIQELSFLLKTEALIDDKSDERRTCSEYEYYDKHFGVCRILQCPIFHLPRHGKCESLIIQGSSKLNYMFYFKVSSTSPATLTENETLKFAKLLKRIILHELNFQKCFICCMRVLSKQHNSTEVSGIEIYTSIVFTTTPVCLEKKIVSTAESLQDKQLANRHQFIKWNQVEFKIEYMALEETFLKQTQNANLVLTYRQSKCKYFLSSKFENCPKIALSSNEFHKISNKSDIGSDIVAKQNNKEIEICVSDYETITGTSAYMSYSFNTYIIFVVLSALFGDLN